MSISVKKVNLSAQQAQNEGQLINPRYWELVGDIEVQCTIRLGTINLTIAQLKQLKAEEILQLDQKTNEPVALVLNNQVIAEGELMSHEDHFAVQITKVNS